MTNKKNNINELVFDDDSTAELEAITFKQERMLRQRAQSESDENTCDLPRNNTDESKTIGKLQYDIEQLRAKWLGVEAEVKARAELTDRLNVEITELQDALAHKDKLIEARDGTISALKSEIQDRDERRRSVTSDLTHRIETALEAAQDIPAPPEATQAQPGSPAYEDQLARTEAYADSLRRKLQDALELNADIDNERIRLLESIGDTSTQNEHISADLTTANERIDALSGELDSIRDRHADEIRLLRFELGEAQDTITQTEQRNSQLASDLVDTKEFKEELERMLCDNDNKSQKRIEYLEAELAKMTRIANDFEEKLNSRGESINVLLSELARKSEEVESIEEISDVISDIDDRISEQIDEPQFATERAHRSHDRVTRMLIGKVGEQLLRFPLFKERLTIGRTKNNDIQLNAAHISRRHAVVQTDGARARVIDWGSKNGVYVNSKKVTEHFLKNGDILTIGNAHFRYEERPKRDN
jgi:chromosome segregation ATPase